MRVEHIILAHILSDVPLLEELLSSPDFRYGELLAEDPQKFLHILHRFVYVAYNKTYWHHPDHIFEHTWKHILKTCPPTGGAEDSLDPSDSWLPAIDTLRTFNQYFMRKLDNHIYVKSEHFADWQTLLSLSSPLPIMCSTIVEQYGQLLHSNTFRFESTGALSPEFVQRFIVPNFLNNSYPSPHHYAVEHYLEKEGLNEAHMHLNGTTDFDRCWTTYIDSAPAFYHDLEKGLEGTTGVVVGDLYKQISQKLTPKNVEEYLYVSRGLRAILDVWSRCPDWHAVHRELHPEGSRQISASIPLDGRLWDYLSILGESLPDIIRTHGRYVHQDHDGQIDPVVDEATWMTLAIYQIHEKRDRLADFFLHLYLLFRSVLFQLLVQNNRQYGFDQFQKYTHTEAREAIEKRYKNRMKQLHGRNQKLCDLNIFEGRIAPKPTFPKLIELVVEILYGYLSYLYWFDQNLSYEITQEGHTKNPFDDLTTDTQIPTTVDALLKAIQDYQRQRQAKGIPQRHFKLILAVHFIKFRDQLHETSFHYQKLRNEIRAKNRILMHAIELYPKLRDFICGIDAAANELHAPPEVFSALYRQAWENGFHRFTYHVGEDFNHLLSGVRAIWETVTYLQFKEGDRLGHATAIGLHPQRWLEHQPPSMHLRKGEWLDNLLFCYETIATQSQYQHLLPKIRTEIIELCEYIYGKCYADTGSEQPPTYLYNPEIHVRAWKLRFLDADSILKVLRKESFLSLDGEEIREYELAKAEYAKHPQACKLLELYLANAGCRKRYQDQHEVKRDFFPVEFLTFLQQSVMQILHDRQVIIETLPTSNVRISYYTHHKDHHIFRWMRIPGAAVEGDPIVQVCLGSDDPGIFATSLRNEFYHLFIQLTKTYKMSDQEALAKIAEVNERGKVYGFHN